jgi:hypothetical protein
MLILLEPHDAGKRLRLGAGRIKQLANEGKLIPVARTPRGTKLFRVEDVEALRRVRERVRERAGERTAGGRR